MTLSEWLIRQNMTQSAFAKLIGSDQGHVSDLVHRKVQPKLASMERIAVVTKGAVTFIDWSAPTKKTVELNKLLKGKAER